MFVDAVVGIWIHLRRARLSWSDFGRWRKGPEVIVGWSG